MPTKPVSSQTPKSSMPKSACSLARGKIFPSFLKIHCFGIYKLSQVVQEKNEASFSKEDIKIRHLLILHALKNEGPQTQQGLCEGLWIDRATMVALIQDLVALKCVKKRVSPTDKRSFTVAITKTGVANHKKHQHLLNKLDDTLTRSLSQEEQVILEKLIAKMIDDVLRS